MEGNYKKDGKCESFPKSIINNCKSYNSYIECNECEEGFHLTSTFGCVENEIIPNCVFYLTTSFETECKECD